MTTRNKNIWLASCILFGIKIKRTVMATNITGKYSKNNYHYH